MKSFPTSLVIKDGYDSPNANENYNEVPHHTHWALILKQTDYKCW